MSKENDMTEQIVTVEEGDLDVVLEKKDKKPEKKEKKREKGRRSIQRILVDLCVLPVLALGLILTVSLIRVLDSNMEKELSETLDVAANSLYNTYSLIAAGDYELREDRLYKGDVLLTGNYDVVDALKESYGLDMTLYYGDTRMLTTIVDDNGRRIIGTKADPQTVHWVIDSNHKYFVKNLSIAGKEYYGYYIPMMKRDGSVVGMAFAGKPSAEVKKVLRSAAFKACIISFLAILFTLLFCITANRQITNALQAIMDFLGGIAGGNFDTKMPVSVTRRPDEIGDMGRYAIDVCAELEKKVTTDPLTGLLNRRACDKQLQKMLDNANRIEQEKVTVTIGDIDHFKNVNDTYGHECGDIVLKAVADIFQKAMKGNGLAARWGGEEFLLVFPTPEGESLEKLQVITDRIRDMVFEYGEFEPFNITMSFGVNGHVLEKTQDEIIKQADDCLYDGKMTGRNRIVTTDGSVILPGGVLSNIEDEKAKSNRRRRKTD